MSAALPSSAMLRAADRSEGVWLSAWRRFKSDRVGLVSLAIVIAFLLLIALSALGLVAGNWQREVGVPYANPTFLGPTPPPPAAQIEEGKGPPVDISAVDPLGAALCRMGRARVEAEGRRGGARQHAAAGRRPARPRCAGEGDQGSRDLDLRGRAGGPAGHRDRHRAGRPQRLSSAGASATCWSGSTTCSPRYPASC
ncbi:MAG: hypothetical protein V9G29_17065 [Burkholderiaceae bacterium]